MKGGDKDEEEEEEDSEEETDREKAILIEKLMREMGQFKDEAFTSMALTANQLKKRTVSPPTLLSLSLCLSVVLCRPLSQN